MAEKIRKGAVKAYFRMLKIWSALLLGIVGIFSSKGVWALDETMCKYGNVRPMEELIYSQENKAYPIPLNKLSTEELEKRKTELSLAQKNTGLSLEAAKKKIIGKTYKETSSGFTGYGDDSLGTIVITDQLIQAWSPELKWISRNDELRLIWVFLSSPYNSGQIIGVDSIDATVIIDDIWVAEG